MGLFGCGGQFEAGDAGLGGKSANIIFPDADSVKAAGSGIFFNTGQVCSAGSRTSLAHADIYDEVVERLSARAKSMRIGDPLEASSGGCVSEVQMKRVLSYMEHRPHRGARV